MYGFIQKALGIVNVNTVGDVIEVTGVNGKHIYKDVKRLWKTTRVGEHLFINMDSSSFSFHSFFLPDVLFTLNTLIERGSYHERKRTLAKIRDALMEQTWIARVSKPVKSKLNYDRLNEFHLTPKDFQEEFFEAYDRLTQQYELNGFLFAGAAGSGKTYSGLALAYCLEAELIIVICPKNAIHRVWEDTILTKIKQTPSYYISSVHPHRTGKERICIFHYEDLTKALSLAKQFRNKKTCIILDESHNFNEITSLRTNLFIDFCKDTACSDVLWLSGTPIKAMSKETIPLFRSIDPLFTEDVEASFKKIFRGDAGKAVEILNNRLGIVSFIVPKHRLQLQDPIINPIYIKIPKGHQYTLAVLKDEMAKFIEQRYIYWRNREADDKRFFYSVLDRYRARLGHNREAIVEFEEYMRSLKLIIGTTMYADVRDQMVFCNKYELKSIIPVLLPEERNRFKEVKSAIKYLTLKIKGECLGTVIGGARQRCYVDLAIQIDYDRICETTEKKTIVFTSYVDALVAAAEKCKSQELEPVLVYGATNSRLNHMIKEFETNDRLNPLIATFDSLSTAVPLVMCDVMIMVNVPFRDYEMQQAISRIHRLGADTQTYVYTVFLDTDGEPNISTRSKDILEWSQKEVEKIIGIKSPFEINEENTIDDFNIAVEGLYVEKPAFLDWK